MRLQLKVYGWTGVAASVALLTALGGCQSGGTTPIQGIGSGDRCVNDSQHCIGERAKALNALLLDKQNQWIKTPPTRESFASGVRLFAFKSRKRSLSCNELSHGVREADRAPQVLRDKSGRQLTPAQISRGLMLATEVSRELKREASRRSCRI